MASQGDVNVFSAIAKAGDRAQQCGPSAIPAFPRCGQRGDLPLLGAPNRWIYHQRPRYDLHAMRCCFWIHVLHEQGATLSAGGWYHVMEPLIVSSCIHVMAILYKIH